MDYAIATLWHERQRYLPAVLAVAFSALMASMPAAILLGLVGSMTLPIERSSADLWVMHPRTVSVELGRAIPAEWSALLWSDCEVDAVEPFIQSIGNWTTADGRNELVVVLGCSLESDGIALTSTLTPQDRRLLSQKGGAFINQGDALRLGVNALGDHAQVNKTSVQVVGFVQGMPSLAGPYVICSLDTARDLCSIGSDQTTFLMARCRRPELADLVRNRLHRLNKLEAVTASDFASRSKSHWIIATNVGGALAFMALLGAAVGVSVVSQSMYSALAALQSQFAILRALGVPRRRFARFAEKIGVLITSAGVALSLPIMALLCQVARWAGTNAALPVWLVALSIAMAGTTSFLATLAALRAVHRTDPAILLH